MSVTTPTRKRPGYRLLALATAAVLLLLASDLRAGSATDGPPAIGGPFARLLAGSTDLGPSHADRAKITAALHGSTRPDALIGWAASKELVVRWRPGDPWASVEGAPQDVASAFGVTVHDYRGLRGQVYYASPQQPSVPAPVRDEVSELGRILGYTPHRKAMPMIHPLDVPKHGLSPAQLLTTYNAGPLVRARLRGQGATIVFFEFDGYDQSDLDAHAQQTGLPQFTPVLIGGQPGKPQGETTMDLQVAHGIAPDAQLVVVNALKTVEGDGAYQKIARMFESVDRQFPGAVWSLSIGWGCDKLLRAADLAPIQAALATALSHGTTVFDATGDTAGLECKGGNDWSAPPGPDDVGVDGVASLPAMTSVGGTTLSTDARGRWLAEHAWFDSPLSQGTSGGVSSLFPRPAWQNGLSIERDTAHRRLLPDVAAVADPFTGVRIVFDGQQLVGAGTSQAAPIWAALTVLMNQYLQAHGGHALGDLNPMLYRVAAGANLPGFRDVSLGGNAVDLAVPGYDMVTGLGTPDIDNLVRDLLDIQQGVAPR
jgi:kumamolisin